MDRYKKSGWSSEAWGSNGRFQEPDLVFLLIDPAAYLADGIHYNNSMEAGEQIQWCAFSIHSRYGDKFYGSLLSSAIAKIYGITGMEELRFSFAYVVFLA